ncbi:MAG: putative phage abortive infection protein [Muribaculum sp.]|nr:putative phage abortive infection protein [Muribaculum sp.]
MKKRRFNLLLILAWACTIISAILIVYFSYQFCRKHNFDWLTIKESIIKIFEDTPGDFLWGTIGILLTFTTSLLMFSTFREQRKQFNEQHLTEHSSRFENTFFNLMTMLYNVRKSVNQDIERNSFPETDIESYAKAFIDECKANTELISQCKQLDKTDLSATEIENIGAELGNCYLKFSKERMNPLSYYFRYTYNLINYVADYWKEEPLQTEKYLKFIQAQMSDAEMCLIFYNCLSTLSKDSKFKKSFLHSIDTKNFLQNIDERWLITRSNHKLYPHTYFRFLNRDELDNKL